jgi:hypothetical protein
VARLNYTIGVIIAHVYIFTLHKKILAIPIHKWAAEVEVRFSEISECSILCKIKSIIFGILILQLIS